MSGGEEPERIAGAYMSANAFRALGMRPILGRTFLEGEDHPGAARVIVLGYAVWRDRFAFDPGIIGQSIRANGEQATIIGVMPENFVFPFLQQVWLPLQLDPLALERGQGQLLHVFGRLAPGVSRRKANAQLHAIARRLQREYPETNEGIGVLIGPYTREILLDEGVAMMYTMLGAVLLVLLVACANVANLLLSRAASRGQEVGIRTALGASRGRIATQFLTEALALAAVGGALGIGVAFLGTRFLDQQLQRGGVPFFVDVRLDVAALLFVVALTLLTTLMAGVLPALQATRAPAGDVLRDEVRGSSSFRIGRISKAIVVAEIALSCGLLVGAGLMIRSVTRLRNADYGFEAGSVFTARVVLPEGRYPDAGSQLRYYEDLQGRLAAIPGVQAAALGSALPAAAAIPRSRLELEDRAYTREQDYPLTGTGAISADSWQCSARSCAVAGISQSRTAQHRFRSPS